LQTGPARRPIGGRLFGAAPQRGSLARVSRLDDRGDSREDLWQVIDDCGIGQVACRRERAHARLPVADDLVLPVPEEFPQARGGWFDAAAAVSHATLPDGSWKRKVSYKLHETSIA